MPAGQESLVIIVDYKSTTLRTNPSISVARKVLHILQQHYVETLGRAIVVNLPMLLNFFYKGISPFLDPVTRDKVRVALRLAAAGWRWRAEQKKRSLTRVPRSLITDALQP